MPVIRVYNTEVHGNQQVENIVDEIREMLLDQISDTKKGVLKIVNSKVDTDTIYHVTIKGEHVDTDLTLTIKNK